MQVDKRLNQSQLANLVEISRQIISNIEIGEFLSLAKLILFLCLDSDKNFTAAILRPFEYRFLFGLVKIVIS